MKFKKLEIKPEGSWIKRTIASAHFKKTIVVSLIGAFVGYLLFYIEQGVGSENLWNDQALENVLMGFGFGILLTNSPCARGKC